MRARRGAGTPDRPMPLVLGAAVLAALLSGCGRGGEVTTAAATDGATAAATTKGVPPASAWVTPTQTPDPLLQNLTIPADAATHGMWSAQAPWPMNGLHAVLLPDGKVMTYGTTPDGNGQNGQYLDVWTPSLGLGMNSHTTVYRPDLPDTFCGASTYMADGKLLLNGGNSALLNQGMSGLAGMVYSTVDNGFTRQAFSLASPRWYATMLTGHDGRPIILGGMKPYSEGMQDNPDVAVTQNLASMTPEILEANGWRALPGATSRDAFGPDFLRASYPRAWVAPSGRVFGVSAETMWLLDVAANGGNGSLAVLGRFKTANDNVNLPNTGATNSAVMYDVGRVLQVGGNGAFNGDGRPASRQATIFDFRTDAALVVEAAPMNFPRRFPNAIALADGRVVVTGGTRTGNNNGADAVYAAEIWNPIDNSWKIGAQAAVYRGYHSFSILLPNGAVLSTGGGTPGPVINLNAEIYYPPNLFRAVNGGSQLAPRPVVQGLSGLAYAHGAPIQLDVADGANAAQLVLLGHSSGTHSFNAGQRRIPIAFTRNGNRLSAQIPGETLTPPGYYMLAVVDPNGVPSTGITLAIGQGVKPPSTPTTTYTPPSTAGTIDATPIAAGGTVRYAPTATPGTTYSWNFGDGTAVTAFAADPTVSHAYAAAGVYGVTLTARAADGSTTQRSFLQAVVAPATARTPASSSPLALEPRNGASTRLWGVNPDGDSVAVIDTATRARIAEIAVGASPRSVARAPSGRMWIVNKQAASLSIVDPGTLAVAQTVALPRASQPHGLAFAPDGSAAYVVLEGAGRLLKLDPNSGATLGSLALGASPRHLAIAADGRTLLVSRFITPPLPGESTAAVDTSTRGGEVLVIDGGAMTLTRTVILRHSDRTDTEIQGRGIPNYLAAPVISPDGRSAWVPSKQDNVKRGKLRDGLDLNFQNTVRAISSRIDLATMAEDGARRIDHDNSSLGSAAAYDPRGAYLFVALETSRQVAVVDAALGRELFRIEAGRAPQGVAVSADGRTLFVQNFMDRTVSLHDLTPLMTQGLLRADLLAALPTTAVERLSPDVLLGKQLFHDARDPRLARDAYMSCASCHNDGGQDGRTWDLTGFGEGLRNTIALNGRAGTGHGRLHWSGNFDEVQDFEAQIRALAGGTGLMPDPLFNAGTRKQPLGDLKGGQSADLDALAAYVGSLTRSAPSPMRNADGSFSAAANAGAGVFTKAGCASCHGGATFTISGDAGSLRDIGTRKATSGRRLGGPLTALDAPTLRDVWATAPYLHDGSAPTLEAAIQAHRGNTAAGADLTNLVAYLREAGGEAPAPGTGPSLNLAPQATPSTSYVSPWESLPSVNNGIVPANSADKTGGAYGNWRGNAGYGQTDWVVLGWNTPRALTAMEVYWWNDGAGIGTPTAANVDYWNGTAWAPLGAIGTVLNRFNRLDFASVTTTHIRISMRGNLSTGILELRAWGADGGSDWGQPVTNVAPAAAAGTSFVSAWESLPALKDGTVPANSADNTGGAYGNWRGPENYGQTDWVTLAWPTPQPLVGLEVYWWNDGQGIGTPTMAQAEYWDGAKWVPLGAVGTTLNRFNRLVFNVTTTQVRLSMRSAMATGVLELRALAQSAAPLPAGTTACAGEGGACAVPAGSLASVWYGANNGWYRRDNLGGAVGCNNGVFGDPALGTAKACRYVVSGPAAGLVQ